MFLSSREILDAIRTGEISCSTDIADSDLRPFGIRIHLDELGLKPIAARVHVDGSGGSPEYRSISFVDGSGYVLRPGEFVLGSTREQFGLGSRVAGFLDGRSTLARLGLFIHAGSQIIDGTAITPRSITLEMYNAGPNELVISTGTPIGMLSFFRSETESDTSLIHSQYAAQQGVTPARLSSNYVSEAVRTSRSDQV